MDTSNEISELFEKVSLQMQQSIASLFHLTIRLYGGKKAASSGFIIFFCFVTNLLSSFSFISCLESFIDEAYFEIVLGEIQYQQRY